MHSGRCLRGGCVDGRPCRRWHCARGDGLPPTLLSACGGGVRAQGRSGRPAGTTGRMQFGGAGADRIAVDVQCSQCHRAVDVDEDRCRQYALAPQACEFVEDHFGAVEGERRDDDDASAAERTGQHCCFPYAARAAVRRRVAARREALGMSRDELADRSGAAPACIRYLGEWSALRGIGVLQGSPTHCRPPSPNSPGGRSICRRAEGAPHATPNAVVDVSHRRGRTAWAGRPCLRPVRPILLVRGRSGSRRGEHLRDTQTGSFRER